MFGRKTLDRVEHMLDEAITGNFRESDYDETHLSKLESKWKQYLGMSVLTRENMEKEKENVESLVSDISHQTKTLDFLIQSLTKLSRLESNIVEVRPVRQKLSELIGAAIQDVRLKAEHREIEIINTYGGTGSLLAFILGLIGVLNFINTIVTSVLSREQEFAMMEAVGMTGGQLKRMLCFEGGYYALYTGILSVILSAAVSVLVVKPYGDEMFFFRWHFTLMPLALCLPVLLAVVLLVPAVRHRSMNRVSVVERMRQTIH